MMTYAIALERSEERSRYIREHLSSRIPDHVIIPAVDGKKLSEEEKSQLCDMEAVQKAPWWLNDGALGCALSHRRALGALLDTQEAAAFIVEDDVVLPEDIVGVLSDIQRAIRPDEIILLYYASFETIQLSTLDTHTVGGGALYYPVNPEKILTATAYVIGREAARKMVDAIVPVRVTADSWFHFYQLGCFRYMRLLYPMKVQVHHFKSSIDYVAEGSFAGRISGWVDRYRIPVLYQLLRYRRKRRLEPMLQVRLTDLAPMTEINS